MTPLAYLRMVLGVLREISQETGYPMSYLEERFAVLYLDQRVGIEEFRSLRLYEFTRRKARHYLMWEESARSSDRLNAGATEEELRIFKYKQLFNQAMRRFMRRESLFLPETEDEALQAFLDRNPSFLVKPCNSMQGNGISKCAAADWTAHTLRRAFDGEYLAESLIPQHPALNEVNPSSVNTVRYIAARHGDAVAPVGAGLRVGVSGQFVDNFHHGGVAYPLDIETGIVTGPGIDYNGNRVLRHPGTDRVMPGLRIPFWEETAALVRQAAVTVPHIGYVGWDIAITPEGPELVEGNINYPGNTVIQIDGPGPAERLRAFLREQALG